MTVKGNILASLPVWASTVPYQIKSIAVKDACLAVGAAKRKCKAGGGFQEVRFRSRKNPVQSCYIPKSAVSNGGIYYTIAGNLSLSEPLPQNIGDCRLVLCNGRWYLTVPYTEKRQPAENQGRVVALDPGVRTFQSFFAENSCGKLGVGDFNRVQRLCAFLDKLVSAWRVEKKSLRRKRLKSACARTRNRIRDLVDELHHKVARFLVDNFDVILLPTFESSHMTRRTKRRIRSKIARSMLTFSHYRFKQYLKHKAFERGKIVLDVNEAWTSKTVSWTGEINQHLGSAKIVRSKKTGIEMDRDYNGARGIFLRALRDHSILKSNLQDVSAPDVN